MARAAEARRKAFGLSAERAKLYARLEGRIGNTPLRRLQVIPVPNECRIYLKEEYRNPTGSHYDRETLPLLRNLEATGRITPGKTTLWETTTGSSGASFAWMCRVLGYKAKVLIPRDMPAARIEQIRSYGAEVILSPETYIHGLVEDFRERYFSRRRELGPDNVAPNHSLDPEAWKFMEGLGQEILDQFATNEGTTRPDFFVAALGNGISARGVGAVLDAVGTKIYGMEPFESPSVYHRHFADLYKSKFGAGEPKFGSHVIYGTGPGQTITFPNIKDFAPKLQDVFHPRKEDVLGMREKLMFEELQLVGNSSAACVWASLELAKKHPRSTIVTIMYDAAWRYLPFD